MRTLPTVSSANLIDIVIFEQRQKPISGNADHAVNPAIKLTNISALLLDTNRQYA